MDRRKDQYPTFTFCFADNPKFVYSDAVKELSLSKEEYSKLLTGNANITDENFLRALENGNEKFSMQLQNIILKIDFETKDPRKSVSIDKNTIESKHTNIKDLPLYISHQDPDRICFTRKEDVEFGQEFLRIEDRVHLETTYIGGVSFLLYTHYPGQFTRYIQRPVYETNLTNAYRTMTKISANIAYVGLLRKRPESNIPCNPTIENDDNEFKIRVMKKVGCIPAYWKFMAMNNYSLDLCKNRNQLKEVYQFIKDPMEIMKQYDPPCEEMQIPVTVKELQKNGRRLASFEMVIRYTTEIYQEIQNFRDYNLDTLWSSIGGFVGIFLGYSLLQLPDLLRTDWKRYWNMMLGKRKNILRLDLKNDKHQVNI